MQDRADRLEALKSLRCPVCRVSVLPHDGPPSLLVDQVRAVFLRGPWRDVAELLLPTAPPRRKLAESGPLDSATPPHNCVQGNTPHVIEMPRRAQSALVVESWKEWYLRRGRALARDTASLTPSHFGRYRHGRAIPRHRI